MLRQHEELSHNDDKLDKLEPVEVMKTSISQALVVAKNVTVFLFNKINSVQKNSFKVNLFWLDCVGGSSSLGLLQTRIHGFSSHSVYFQLVVSCKAYISNIYNMSSESYTIGRYLMTFI